MHSSGSVLKTMLEKIRFNVNLPMVDRYSDDTLARFHLMPAYVEVLERIRMSSSNPIILRHSFSTVVAQEHYILPPCISEVWRLTRLDTNGNIIDEFDPRGQWHPTGPGWMLQENMISFRPFPSSIEQWDVWYVPSFDATIHFAADGKVIGTTKKIIELSASPELGHLDQRINAYAGAVLRKIHAGEPHEERVISSYDQTTREASIDVAFTVMGAENSAVTYEIAPIGTRALGEAIAAVASLHMGVSVNVTQKKILMLELLERRAIKAARDKISNLMGRYAKYFESDTIDARDRVGGHSTAG